MSLFNIIALFLARFGKFLYPGFYFFNAHLSETGNFFDIVASFKEFVNGFFLFYF